MSEYKTQNDIAKKLAKRFDDFRMDLPDCYGAVYHVNIRGTEYEVSIEVKE